MIGAASELLVFRRTPGVTAWQWIQLIVVCVAFVASGLSSMRSRAMKMIAYWTLHASCVLALWVTNRELAASGVPFQTFLGYKATLIAGALIAPTDLVIALPMFASTALVPVIEWSTWPPAWHAHLAAGEPFGTVAFGVIAVALYAYRIHSATLQRRVIEGAAEAATLERVARMALAVCDLTNTPLQTIAANLQILKLRGALAPEQLERLERAVERLKELSHRLEPYSASLTWDSRDVAIDSRAVIDGGPITLRDSQ
jgi:hypothetical protein